jgi:hypothetical protein
MDIKYPKSQSDFDKAWDSSLQQNLAPDVPRDMYGCSPEFYDNTVLGI